MSATTEDQLSDEQFADLLNVLRLVENAESKSEAVWLDEESRETVSEIRETLE